MPTHTAVSPPLPSLGTVASLTDAQLTQLLRLRPDLASPPPRSLSDLAARASTAGSIIACWESLDRFAIQVIHALCLLPAADRSVAGATALFGGEVTCGEVAEAVERLRSRALVTVQPGPLHVHQGLLRLHPHPAGMGRPFAVLTGELATAHIAGIAATLGLSAGASQRNAHALPQRGSALKLIADYLATPSCMLQLMHEAPEEAQLVLYRLATAGDPVLTEVHGYSRTAYPWLVWLADRGLLVAPHDWAAFEVPREVCLALRNGRVFARASATAPAMPTVDVDDAAVQTAAAHAADRAIRFVERVVSAWGASPPRQLQSQGGGLRVQDLRRAAQMGEMEEADASRLIEIALSAELIAHEGIETVQPTVQFDAWLAASPGDRWLWLVRAWRDSQRQLSVHGLRDGRDKAVPPLMRFYPERRAAVQRSSLLAAMAAAPPGRAMAEGSDAVEHVTWTCPASWAASYRPVAETVDAIIAEATLLGVVAHRSLTRAARLAVSPDAGDAQAREAAAAMFPAAVVELSLQGDLTAVAVGTVEPAMRVALEGMADLESRGAASVYRFSEASLRRALDQGRSAGEIIDFLTAHARRGVPQPLEYLIRDVAARHGRLRGGSALCYVRCDDEALVAEVAGSRRIRGRPLRRIAPTVLVSDESLPNVIARLREAGFMPVAEGANGVTLSERPVQRRLRDPRRAQSHKRTEAHAPTPHELADMVRRMRAARDIPSRVLSLYPDEGVSDITDVDCIENGDEPDAITEMAVAGELSYARPGRVTTARASTRRRGRRRR